MPDDNGSSNGGGGHSWSPANVVMVLSSVTGMVIGIINAVQIRDVDSRQTEQVERAGERDSKLDKIGKSTEKAEETAKKVASSQQDTMGLLLYSTWKHLENVASHEDSTPEDQVKAKEAKTAYDNYVKKKP